MIRFLKYSFLTLFCLIAIGCIFAASMYFKLSAELPNTNVLNDAEFQVPLRIYSSDKQLIAEFGTKKRIPVTLEQVPKPLIHAVLATEDSRFYSHPGVDFIGLSRAAVVLLLSGKKIQGGSTITMQVARNFFLSSKKTYTRKLKEILLAIKIDKEVSKNKILELYLNKIYFGKGAYGVAAAAQIYYGKSLDELTLAQMAMIAGLPKAPSSNNPLSDPQAALKRRNHVLQRMYELHYINKEQYLKNINEPITAKFHTIHIGLKAPYVAEVIRKSLYEQFGQEIYTKGFQVYTTINSRLQRAANQSLRTGLLAYDKRHGYRGPLKKLGEFNTGETNTWEKDLKKIPVISNLYPGAVIEVKNKSVTVLLENGKTIEIPWKGLSWARAQLADGRRGRQPKSASDIVQVGDVIRVSHSKTKGWRLTQIPRVEGALVSLNPEDGAIQALVGGFNFQLSHFDRATQAERQPGSSFKPFIYAAALAKGYTLASVINDAPVVIHDPGLNKLWRPQNHSRKFFGPTRLRVGLTQSRNLVSIRLLQDIGIPYTLSYLSQFGFKPNDLPHSLSLALGTGDVTPAELASGYAVFANGGYKIQPYIISRITNGNGENIYRADPKTACEGCSYQYNAAPRVITPQVAYLMTSAMQSVIQSGTGKAAKVLRRVDLAGKTGTTDDQNDAWFAGFNHRLVSVVWVGFDTPQSLHEYGAQSALPIWIQFMRVALQDTPETTMPEPNGLVAVKIDKKTGLLASNYDHDTIFELFRKQYVPERTSPNPDENIFQELDENYQDSSSQESNSQMELFY